jgi:hypothetical protein
VKRVNFVRREEDVDGDEWEERVSRVNWTPVKNRFSTKWYDYYKQIVWQD